MMNFAFKMMNFAFKMMMFDSTCHDLAEQVAICIKDDGFCITMMNFVFKMMNFVFKFQRIAATSRGHSKVNGNAV